MKTLYDLLDAHPSDNAEALRGAFRKAAKANHPDLHGGDPDAAVRFRQIADAYEILRDAERRATYDCLLQFERERVGWKSKSTASYPMHSVVFDAVISISLAIVLAVGMTYAHRSKTHAEDLAGTGGRESTTITVVQPARPTDTNKRDERREGPVRNAGPNLTAPNAVAFAASHDLASEPAVGGPVPQAAGLNAEVANIANALGGTLDRTGPNGTVERLDQTAGTEKLDQDRAQLVKVVSSSGESNNGGGKSLSSDFAMSGDKRDVKRSETHDINVGDAKVSDAKLPETRIPPKARIVAKRQPAGHTEREQRQAAGHTEFEQPQAAGHTEFEQRQAAGHTEPEQTSLADKSACSRSCARDVSPPLGVGF